MPVSTWAEAPAWANFEAQDADGRWYFYSHRPIVNGKGFYMDISQKLANGEYLVHAAGKSAPSTHWRTSLEERPHG